MIPKKFCNSIQVAQISPYNQIINLIIRIQVRIGLRSYPIKIN